MSDKLDALTKTLTDTQNTLSAIVAANPQPQEDLTAAQTLADANNTAAKALATALNVTVPAPAPAPAPADQPAQ